MPSRPSTPPPPSARPPTLASNVSTAVSVMPPVIPWRGTPITLALPPSSGRGPCSTTPRTGGAAPSSTRSRARAAATTVTLWAAAPVTARTSLIRCQPSPDSSAKLSVTPSGESAMLDLKLYMAQRLTALLMAPLVIGHIAVMIYAIQGGLSAAEILGRTQGSVFWFAFYGLFVIAVSIHAAIGLRTILGEWAGLRGGARDGAAALIGLGLFALGVQAVWAVTA